jgi:hypothetical protein
VVVVKVISFKSDPNFNTIYFEDFQETLACFNGSLILYSGWELTLKTSSCLEDTPKKFKTLFESIFQTLHVPS